MPIRLPDILFSKNSARVNNCGKRILLEQLHSYYERDSSGTVVFVGHQSGDETGPQTDRWSAEARLAAERVLNAAAVVTASTTREPSFSSSAAATDTAITAGSLPVIPRCPIGSRSPAQISGAC